jgi:hypothetical protein
VKGHWFVAILGVMFAGCQGGIAPEATEQISQALDDCVTNDIDALWARTTEGFRQETSRDQLAEVCFTLSERIGEFRSIGEMTDYGRRVQFAQPRSTLTMSFDAQFAVGEVDVEVVLARFDGEWLLHSMDFKYADAPMLPEDEEALMALGAAQRDRLLTGDFGGFYDAMHPALQADLGPRAETVARFEGAMGAMGAITAGEPVVMREGERMMYRVPLSMAAGASELVLQYEWRGAVWALLAFNVTQPVPTGPPGGGSKP